MNIFKSYKVKYSMIDPQLRWNAFKARLLKQDFNKDKFIEYNEKARKLSEGVWNAKNVKVEEIFIDRKDGSKLRVLLARPNIVKPNVPAVLWLHGGGFATGMPDVALFYADDFARESSCVSIIPDYTLSVDKPYPAALEDSYLTLEWIVENANNLNINADQIFVGGESAGAGLVAALTLYARDMGKINVAFQMPLYPMLDNSTINANSKNCDAPVWDYLTNKVAWELYLSDLDKDIPIYAVPSLTKDYKNIPPTCSFVGELDLFYDEVNEYIKNLKNSNVEVFFETYKGCFHAFEKRVPTADISIKAKKFVIDCFNYACKNYFAPNKK